MTDVADFDPNAAASSDGIFGLPVDETARVRLLGVPFEATCSYGVGTSEGPRRILEASAQVDLLDPHFEDVWSAGIVLEDLDSGVSSQIRDLQTRGAEAGDPAAVQEISEERSALVEDWTRTQLEAGRIPGILGGDHSVPLGAIRAAAAREKLSILHIDAHHDLRDAYGGVRESHASIMRNVLNDCPDVERIVQVGIRDYCREEAEFARAHTDRVAVFYAHEMNARRFAGTSFDRIVDAILAMLGELVWVSFDVDGLDPAYCPGTGTPVPGGLSFDEAAHLIARLARSRRVVGFDLCEVAGGEWDGNVGARLTYKLCGACTAQQSTGQSTGTRRG